MCQGIVDESCNNIFEWPAVVLCKKYTIRRDLLLALVEGISYYQMTFSKWTCSKDIENWCCLWQETRNAFK